MAPRTTTRRKAAPKAKPVEEEIEDLELDEVEEDEVVEETPKPARRTRRTPAKKAAAEVEEEDEDDEPAPAPKRRGRPAKKAAPVVEEDESEEDDDEEEAAPAPRRRGRPAAKKAAVVEDDEDEEDEEPPAKAKRQENQFGTAWLAEIVAQRTGKEYTPYDLRALLRKLAKKGTIDREIGVERARYEFKGPKDPVVAALVKMVKGGEIEAAKKESLDKLKDKAAAKKGTTVTRRATKKAAPVVEDVDEDFEAEDDDFEELED